MEAQIQLEKTLIYLKSLSAQEAAQYMKILSKSQMQNISDVFINRVLKLSEEINQNNDKIMQEIQDSLTLFKFIYKQMEKGQILYFQDPNFGFADKLTTYIQMETNQEFITGILQILGFWINQRNIEMYCFNQNLFKVLSTKFTQENSHSYQVICKTMTIMLLKNTKNLIKYANNPYHYMQCLILIINRQKSEDQLHFWLQSIIKLYTKLQDYSLLFHSKDFKVLIDIIINLIENFPSQKILKCCLQLYVIFWDQNQKYRIQDVKFMLKELKNNGGNTQFQDHEISAIIQQIMDY